MKHNEPLSRLLPRDVIVLPPPLPQLLPTMPPNIPGARLLAMSVFRRLVVPVKLSIPADWAAAPAGFKPGYTILPAMVALVMVIVPALLNTPPANEPVLLPIVLVYRSK